MNSLLPSHCNHMHSACSFRLLYLSNTVHKTLCNCFLLAKLLSNTVLTGWIYTCGTRSMCTFLFMIFFIVCELQNYCNKLFANALHTQMIYSILARLALIHADCRSTSTEMDCSHPLIDWLCIFDTSSHHQLAR